jgi:general secretion pathway protein G
MKKHCTKNTIKKQAFSLVELIVVILILGILASAVSLEVFSYLGESKVTKAKTDIETFSKAIEQFRMRNNGYPETLDDLTGVETDDDSEPFVYIKRIVKDPWGNDYVYIPDTDNEYDIICYGQDGEEGGDGLDADITNFESIEDEE